MSKHSIRDRQALEVERLAQLLERLDAAQPLLLGDGRRRARARAARSRRRARRAAASRRAAARAPRPASRAGRRGTAASASVSATSGRDDDLRRDRRRARRSTRAQNASRIVVDVLALDVLEVERVAVDHLARRGAGRPARRRGRPRRRAPITSIVPDRALVGGLPLGQALDREAAGCGSAPPPRSARRRPPRASAARARARIGRVSPERNSITPSMISP